MAVLYVSGSAVEGQHGDGVNHDGAGWVAPRRSEVGKYLFIGLLLERLLGPRWSLRVACTWCFPGAS